MAHRWTAGYQVSWTPLMTFTRRRNDLVDWFEANIEPVAFTEDHTSLGVALGSPALRVVVYRDHMAIQAGVTEHPLATLGPALEAVFAVMRPQEAVLDLSTTAWTVDLGPGADYDAVRGAFAGRLAGGRTVGGFQAVDASALVDFDGPQAAGQVEWGVVTAPELLTRLTHPAMSRLTALAPVPVVDMADPGLPATSIFADVRLWRKVAGVVTDSKSVFDAVAESDAVAQSIVDGLRPTVEGDGSEFVRTS